MKQRFKMKCLILPIILCLCLSIQSHALTFFRTDYDGDTYRSETAYSGDWLPLRELSEILPYSVEWKDRTVYIYADRTWEIKPDRWMPEGVSILDGVTYVTPDYMRRFLPGISFLYEDELYVFNGEAECSRLVRGSTDFRAHTLTVLYRLRLALPEDYQLIRNSLTGGVEETALSEGLPYDTLAYVYPTIAQPTAHIVANRSDANLAELIAHEAYHVHLTRSGRDSEELADEYGWRVKRDLLEIT